MNYINGIDGFGINLKNKKSKFIKMVIINKIKIYIVV